MYSNNIARLNIDSTNNSDQTVSADITCSMREEIIAVPEDYTITVEKAEIAITTIPITYLDKPVYIMIDYPPGLPPHPILQPKENYFYFSGEIKSLDDFISKVNKIVSDDLINYSLCYFSKVIVDGVFRLSVNIGDPIQRTTVSDGIELYFSTQLKFLMDEIPGFYSEYIYAAERYGTVDFYKIQLAELNALTTGLENIPQQRYLLSRLYSFKAIRIFTDLPTKPYYVYDQNSKLLDKSNLLTEVILNSENYSDSQQNVIYIPTAFRYTQMTGQQPVRDFTVYFYVHYKNGYNHRLNYDPGEYISLTLAFNKNQ